MAQLINNTVPIALTGLCTLAFGKSAGLRRLPKAA